MQESIASVLKDRRLFLEKTIIKAGKALKDVPEGRVRCKKKKGRPEYYWVTKPGDTAGRYLSVKETDLVKALAQKAYNCDVLKIAKEELKRVVALEKYRTEHDLNGIYEQYSDVRRELVTPVILPDEEFVKQWLEKEYPKMGFEEGETELFTRKGLRVRSKSEIIIADYLDYLIIPFRFEFPIFLKGWGWVYPDFLVLNVRLRKVYIWEHLGRMDDPDYVKKNIGKVRAYQRNGYHLGDNLILTFETKDQPLDTREVENIVKHYFL